MLWHADWTSRVRGHRTLIKAVHATELLEKVCSVLLPTYAEAEVQQRLCPFVATEVEALLRDAGWLDQHEFEEGIQCLAAQDAVVHPPLNQRPSRSLTHQMSKDIGRLSVGDRVEARYSDDRQYYSGMLHGDARHSKQKATVL